MSIKKSFVLITLSLLLIVSCSPEEPIATQVAISSITADASRTVNSPRSNSDITIALTATVNYNGISLSDREKAKVEKLNWEIVNNNLSPSQANGTSIPVSIVNNALIINKNSDTGTIIVKATSVYDNTKSIEQTIRITAPSEFTLQSYTDKQLGISFDPNKRFINVQISPMQWEGFIKDDRFTQTFNTSLAKQIYTYFNDEFDFITILLDTTDIPAAYSYAGVNIGVSNSVEGIGYQVYNNSEDFGSGGKLKSLIILPYNQAITQGPYLHEIMHNWGNYALESVVGGHWGYMGGNVPGQLGGFRQSSLETNIDGNPNKYRADAFGSFANGGNTPPYTELELYLMGLIPLSSVSDFDLFLDVDQDKTTYDRATNKSTFVATKRTLYTQTKLQSIFNRVPDYTNAQKSFRTIVVLISQNENNKATDASVKTIIEAMNAMSSQTPTVGNFAYATGSRATLSFEIESALK